MNTIVFITSEQQSKVFNHTTSLMHIHRLTFGQSHCEIVLHQSGAETNAVTAFALSVRPDGRLDPVVGEDGRFVQVRAETFSDALSVMKRRLVSLLGDERIDPDSALP